MLVLDEPTAALDVQARRDLWSTLEDYVREHETTVLFSTHYLEEADQNATRIMLVAAGKVTAGGSPEQVKAAAEARRVVRFRLLDGDLVTLRTADADTTVWALYPQRQAIAVTVASLEEAFFSTAVPQANEIHG